MDRIFSEGDASGRCRFPRVKGAVSKRAVPVLPDPEGELSSNCQGQAGGVKKPTVPGAIVGVTNPETDVWQDDDGIPVQENDGQFILVR